MNNSCRINSLAQQDQFIEMVGVWDSAIDATSALVSALERRKQGLMQQLLTGRRRLKGFKGKWKLLRADNLFTEISTRNQTAEEQLLSVTQDRGVIPRDMLVGRVTMPAGTVDAFKLVERDNFVISLRSFQGGLEHSAYRGLVSPAYTVLQASDEIHPAYFRHYFKSTDFVKRLSVAVVGIRDGKQISYTDFRSIKLPLPPMAEQMAMTELLDLADQDIALCLARLAALQTQKRALMQKLLSGEWQVPTQPAKSKVTSKKGL
jgi:type I restriction enzyme S subunit